MKGNKKMMTWLNEISTGCTIYATMIPSVALTILIRDIKNKSFNIARFLLDFMFVAYMMIVISLVFFPLPDAEEAAKLCGYSGRFIPFVFIKDIAKDRSLSSVLQVLFNVAMTIPFGAYLTYRFGFSKKQVLVYSVILTLFIEIGQLTGLFFIFKGSYRLFDVDDLFLNTLGGFIGYIIITKLSSKLRTLESFEYKKKVVERVAFNYHY